MKRLHLIWLGALCLARPVYALSLPDLEADLEQALPVLIAEAEVQHSQAVRNQRGAEQGWKFLGGAGFSNDILPTSEGVTTSGTSSVPTSVQGASSVVSAGTSNFQRLTGRVGVRYPLLGSRLTEKLALLAAEAQVDVSTAKKQIAKLDAQFALRRCYINYWGAQRKIELTKAFLDLEAPVEAVLSKRKQAGLLLESDRLEFLTAFSLARRNFAKLEAIQEASRMSLNVLTKRDLERFDADYPTFPIPCLNDQQLAARIVDHPEMQLYRRIVSEKADGLQFA
ncbi:MAG: TolC family protein, partial [Gammaproteobacteria bacterium]